MAHWYYGNQGAQVGPLDDATIRVEISRGVITPETLVWRDGLPSWLPLAQVQELSDPWAVQAYYGPPGYAPLPTSGNATASLVIGLVAFGCFWPLGLLAVIFGHLALNQIRDSPMPMGGRGMALAGLILGYIELSVILSVVVVLVV